MLIKTAALILSLLGFTSLVMIVLGIFGGQIAGIGWWALAIPGLVCFSAGSSLLKWRDRG